MAGNLFHVYRTGSDLVRRQAGLLILGLLIPVASNLLYLFDVFNLPGVDWDPITFSLAGFVYLVALYGNGLMDLMPVARNTLVESLPDGILVLDERGRLADFNPAAAAIFGLRPRDLWAPAHQALAAWPEMLAIFERPGAQDLELITGRPAKTFNLRLSPLSGPIGGEYGKLVMLRDFSERARMEHELRASSEKFEKAFHSSPDAIIISRLEDGTILEVNESLTRLTGYPLAQVEGLTTLALGLWLDQADRAKFTDDLRLSGRVQGRELQFRKKSGEIFTALLSAETLELQGEVRIISTLVDITSRKQAEEQLILSQAELADQHRELARLEERQRVARNLHDSVSQSIHSLVLFSETLEALIEKGNYERARQVARQVREGARQAHKETRLLLYDLQNPLKKRFDLLNELEERLKKVERRTGIHAELLAEGLFADVTPNAQEDLYWIAIEALNNALKHSQAASVQVLLRCSPETLNLEVRDDGQGFNLANTHSGMGLNIMWARAQQLGGDLNIGPNPGGGTRVWLTINRKAPEYEKYPDLDRR